MNIYENIIFNLVIAAIAFTIIWFKLQIKLLSHNQIDLEQKHRDSFKNLLVLHSDLILGKHIPNKPINEWMDKFSEMTISILLWGSDEVIYEYGKYAELRYTHEKKFTEREYHFANAILAFRKGLGHNNPKDKIKAENIIIIFKIGYCDEL